VQPFSCGLPLMSRTFMGILSFYARMRRKSPALPVLL